MSQFPIVTTIMGPTASGKTGLAIELAKRINGEVISVDSALVYTDMDIGTAKPDANEQAGIRHHLIDVIAPEQSYSVAEFRRDCVASINSIVERGKQPILAGGTMMYFNALINGLSSLPESQPEVRQQIQQEINEQGLEKLHHYLANIDPPSAIRIHSNDSQRITRAIEVFRISGKTMSEWQQQVCDPLPYDFRQFSIMPQDRADLHKRIEQRFDLMLSNGFENEVAKLMQRTTLTLDMPSMRSVGYRQMWQYLSGELKYQEMRERGIIATRQLAKRQLTWLRGWETLVELDTYNTNNIDIIIENLFP